MVCDLITERFFCALGPRNKYFERFFRRSKTIYISTESIKSHIRKKSIYDYV